MGRRSFAFLLLCLAFASCSDRSLENTGDGSTNWIGQGAPSTVTTVLKLSATTTTQPPGPEAKVITADGVSWVNDDLEPFVAEMPKGVADLVWDSSNGSETFVQAHRTSIARALPGVKFPSKVPDDVGYVSSQLIFKRSTGELTEEWLAAFGLWSAPPYSTSRASGQAGVLYVGHDLSGDGFDRSLACASLTGVADSLCTDVDVVGVGWVSEVIVPDGVKLIWSDGQYQYELFHRTNDDAGVVELMAASMVELTDLDG